MLQLLLVPAFVRFCSRSSQSPLKINRVPAQWRARWSTRGWYAAPSFINQIKFKYCPLVKWRRCHNCAETGQLPPYFQLEGCNQAFGIQRRLLTFTASAKKLVPTLVCFVIHSLPAATNQIWCRFGLYVIALTAHSLRYDSVSRREVLETR